MGTGDRYTIYRMHNTWSYPGLINRLDACNAVLLCHSTGSSGMYSCTLPFLMTDTYSLFLRRSLICSWSYHVLLQSGTLLGSFSCIASTPINSIEVIPTSPTYILVATKHALFLLSGEKLQVVWKVESYQGDLRWEIQSFWAVLILSCLWFVVRSNIWLRQRSYLLSYRQR